MAKHKNNHTPTKIRFSWNDPFTRGLIYQVVIIGLLAFGVWYLVSNTLHNLAVRNISTGFDFLNREAGFAIGEMSIDYQPSDTYGRAIVVGLINTLKVSVIGIVLATVLGTLLGIARLSSNWLVKKVASVYVEVMRNVPLLLQLFFWYALITETLPRPKDAYSPLPGVFMSNRGLKVPTLDGYAWDWIIAGLAIAIILSLLFAHWARKRQAQTGNMPPVLRISGVLLIAVPALLLWISGEGLHLNYPELRGFNFQGGTTLTPEFAALLLGLVVYTSAFIAEVVRSGIQAVSKGQWEAAESIGLSRSLTLRIEILPQSVRESIPTKTSHNLNINKNSSLAVAIGYPDIVSVVNTTLNQTGQAIEGILLIMAAYLTVSLSISVFMNWYNRRLALVER